LKTSASGNAQNLRVLAEHGGDFVGAKDGSQSVRDRIGRLMMLRFPSCKGPAEVI